LPFTIAEIRNVGLETQSFLRKVGETAQAAGEIVTSAFQGDFRPPGETLELAGRSAAQFADNPSVALRARILLHMNACGERANVLFSETQGIGEVRIARPRQVFARPHVV